MKVVAATTVTGPYISARYTCFAESYPEHDLTLLEFGGTSGDYPWTQSEAVVPYRRLTLFDGPVEQQPRRRRRAVISRALGELDPDVLVVCGYGITGMGAALHWAQASRRGVSVVMLSDSTEADRARTGWKESVKRRVVGRCGSALVAGTPHRAYICSLGMPQEKVWEGYDVVDNEFFWKSAQNARAEFTRTDLDLPQHYFLTCARFLRSDSGVPRPKNLHRLLYAYQEYTRRSDAPWKFVIVGDGELRSELSEQIDALGISDSVMLAGFKQYSELPRYYAFADAFILASIKDTWGLVVNEAMACGLPVLVSERCGCATDLIRVGENGFTFNPEEVGQLVEFMLHISSSHCDRRRMGQASRAILSRWTPETFARGLAHAIEAAAGSPRYAPTLADKAILWGLSLR